MSGTPSWPRISAAFHINSIASFNGARPRCWLCPFSSAPAANAGKGENASISLAKDAPWCLHLLDKEQLALYATLRDLVRQWALWLCPGCFPRHGAETAGLSPLAQAAVEIIAASLPRTHGLYREARLWRRALYSCGTSKTGTKTHMKQQAPEN
ncbi:hypothetical protein QO002_002767 [Pararhizobium capsulatum DSM 1112]|uniref:Uncharacterized protein n=1 Tax=Pararhizobium capsulatum DSM 1112 TaxID=1121113 RepID=A0ABU0BQX2_9HYPH|nr:hypothetical protein [Pararhizobium capsulatum]MDQ0320629.1 hypothetical protein [Pararhizobium capsulatum DSM 1112]